MKKLKILITMFFIMVILIWFQENASAIDCSKKLSETERLICGNEDLKIADKRLNNSYDLAVATNIPKEHDAIKKSQREWLRLWDKSCTGLKTEEEKIRCLKSTYNIRESKLEFMIKNGLLKYKDHPDAHLEKLQYDEQISLDNKYGGYYRFNDHEYMIYSYGKLYYADTKNRIMHDLIYCCADYKLLGLFVDKGIKWFLVKQSILRRGRASESYFAVILIPEGGFPVQIKELVSIGCFYHEDESADICKTDSEGELQNIDYASDSIDFNIIQKNNVNVITFRYKEKDCKTGKWRNRIEQFTIDKLKSVKNIKKLD